VRISHDPTGLVTLEELTISNVWEIAALGGAGMEERARQGGSLLT